MNFYTSVLHPYGVQPSGNFFWERDPIVRATRSRGLGLLSCLNDEALMEFLSFVSPVDLISLILSSRTFYVYGHFTDLWRDLTIRQWNGQCIEYINTWKDTFVYLYLKMERPHCPIQFTPHCPIRVNGIFSNVLHRSWVCHSCDLEVACQGILRNEDIDHRNSNELSNIDFIEQYERKNKPVVIENACDNWPALVKWSEEYLSEACGDEFKFRATSSTAPLAATFSGKEYFKYAKEAKEEAPLYLFERDFASSSAALDKDYSIPSYFSFESAELGHGTDLFRLLGDKGRPDYRWLIAGPARSGSIFHVDPNQTNAWNVSIKGRKKWIFYPPGVSPPGVVQSDDGADVTVPITTGEWLLSFWKDHLEARQNVDPANRPLETIVNPGEVIFVPHGYWHMVVNLDDCIALTHNYVSTSNLADCLRFLRDSEDQISGVRDRGDEAVQPEAMYETFLRRLKENEGVCVKHVLENALQESYLPDKRKCKLAKHSRSGPVNKKRRTNPPPSQLSLSSTSTTSSVGLISNYSASDGQSSNCSALPIINKDSDDSNGSNGFSFGFSF